MNHDLFLKRMLKLCMVFNAISLVLIGCIIILLRMRGVI